MSERRTYRSLARGDHRCDVIALTSSNRLRDRDGATWLNTYYDYIDEPLPSTLYYYIDSTRDRMPHNQPSVFVGAGAHWFEMMRMKRGRNAARETAATLYRELAGFLAQAAPGLRPPFSLTAMEHEAVRFAVQFDAFRNVLKGATPAVVLSDCYYDRTWAVAAARSLGTPVLELQHGIVYDEHIAYRFHASSVTAHRDTLPIPDRILSFGPYFSRVLAAGGGWKAEDITDAGFPRMEVQQQRFSWSLPGSGGRLRVLVSGQWILTTRLRRFLGDLLRALPTGTEIVVKPHPLDSPGVYDGIDGVDVCEPQMDFYAALAGCHLHASVFSTTLVESVGLGVPTIVIGLPGAENASALVESGACRRVDSAGELGEVLRSMQADPDALLEWHRQTQVAARDYWAPDSRATTRRVLAEVIERFRSGE